MRRALSGAMAAAAIAFGLASYAAAPVHKQGPMLAAAVTRKSRAGGSGGSGLKRTYRQGMKLKAIRRSKRLRVKHGMAL